MEQSTRAGYPVTFSVDLTGTCAASAEYLTVQVVGLGAAALPTYRTCQQLPLGRCRQCLLFPISLTPSSLSLSPLSRSVSAEECCLPATCTCGAKIKGIPLLFRLFSSCTHTSHTHSCLTHTHSHLLAALWCKLCRRSENKCCICMRHDMSQVLSTPHPHATLSPQLPSLPRITYPSSPYSPPY